MIVSILRYSHYRGDAFLQRLLLSIAARLLDPLGFLTPYSITLRISFQEVRKRRFEWDNVLPTEFQENINKWVTDLSSIKEWKIPYGDASKWKQFVQNGVQEIRQHTSPDRWKFCPGKENPANLLTRGVKAQELTQLNQWLHRLTWLDENI